MLSGAMIPDLKPSVFPVIQHVRSLVYEQTDAHMPIPIQAVTREVTDICSNCGAVGHSWQDCSPSKGQGPLPIWEGFNFNPHWSVVGLSQIDQERLAIGRWAAYIPYRDPQAKDLVPQGTKLKIRCTFRSSEKKIELFKMTLSLPQKNS